VNATAEWEVPLAHGENRLRAGGVRDGRVHEDAAVVRYDDRTAVLRDAGSAARDLAVNAGSLYSYVDASGLVWEADQPYAPGGWGFEGGEAQLSHRRVAGTAEDALFQAVREGVRAYRFDVPDGSYEVRLGFAELRDLRPGMRRFRVLVNDRPLLAPIDLAADARPATALERTVVAEAAGGRGIVVRFEGEAGAPVVSAIHLRRRRP
jgi:beta-galactosidase